MVAPPHGALILETVGKTRHAERQLAEVRGGAREEVHRASRARKGHWRLSQNELVRWAMNNQWLAERGLSNLEKQWCSIRYPEGPNGQQVANWNLCTELYAGWCGPGANHSRGTDSDFSSMIQEEDHKAYL